MAAFFAEHPLEQNTSRPSPGMKPCRIVGIYGESVFLLAWAHKYIIPLRFPSGRTGGHMGRLYGVEPSPSVRVTVSPSSGKTRCRIG